MIKSRLAKLEKAYKNQIDAPRVFIVHQDDRINHMEIAALDFSGSIDEGRRLLDEYPHCTVIIDDIPRWKD